MLDLDHFKAINDQFGHQVGDAVLIESAHILKETVDDTDIVGRWGGEEFLVISSNKGTEEALELAQNLRRQLESNSFSEVIHVTASFGVATYIDGDTHKSLLSRSDEALYKAKEKGKNQVAVQ